MRALPMRSLLALVLMWSVTACQSLPEDGGFGVGHQALWQPELDDVELEFLRILNEYRAENGAPPLAPVDEINAAADAHSEDMGLRSYFAHEALEPAPYGVVPWDRMCFFEYGPACDHSTVMGENIAAGYPDAFGVFEAWRNSPGHDENMRNAQFRAIGIARVFVEHSVYSWYWTNDFAGDDPECSCADGQQRSCMTDDCGAGRSVCADCEFGPCEVPGRGDREICGDHFDNDCDGEVDEDEDCGPRCEPEPEVCDGVDNDCDEEVDEDEVCDIPDCHPVVEICGDGLDNDCDHAIDNGCACDSRPDNPFCGSEVGQCTTGTQECEVTDDGRVLTNCRGAVVPSMEICDDLDNDCDGMTNEGLVCSCADITDDTLDCVPVDQGCECGATGRGAAVAPLGAGTLLALTLIIRLRGRRRARR